MIYFALFCIIVMVYIAFISVYRMNKQTDAMIKQLEEMNKEATIYLQELNAIKKKLGEL